MAEIDHDAIFAGDACFICGEAFKPGVMVMPDITEGLGHTACFGPERESYVKDIETGEPLGPDDPLPTGYPWTPDPSRRASTP